MSVQLIEITENAEDLILYIARVSSNQDNTDVGLLRYLIREGHWSPFEMAHATVEFNTSLDVATQMLRHRSFSFQQFSQRYASPSEFLMNHGRRQAEKNRQSSTDDLDPATQEIWQAEQERVYYEAMGVYQWAIDNDIARECARSVLPQATKTKLYMSGSIRSWIHYFEQRCDEHTQLEHRLLAEQARFDIGDRLPTVAEALNWTTETQLDDLATQ